jgi:hypothetical protein
MTNDLLQQGIAALRAGSKAQARQLLARAIQEDPQNEQAWLWLSGAVESDEERLECLNRTLAIDPNNEMAQRGLAALRQKQPSRPSAPAPSQTARQTMSDPVAPQSGLASETVQAPSISGPTCAACGAEIPQGQAVVLRGKDKKAPPKTICPNCATSLEKTFEAETENPNLLGALALGLSAAVISALVWYLLVALTHYQIGFVAVGVGFLIGVAVRFGAGGQRGIALQLASVAITLLAMGTSEYLIVRHFAAQALAEEGYTSIPLVLPIGLMLMLVVESIKSDPLTLLFWGIAAWEAFAIPGKRRLRKA